MVEKASEVSGLNKGGGDADRMAAKHPKQVTCWFGKRKNRGADDTLEILIHDKLEF